MDIENVSGKANDALYVVRLVGIKRWFENNNLLPFRIAPERYVKIGERNPRVVANTAHNQVIADEQCVFHGLGRNYTRLAYGTVDEKKNQANPKPRNNLAADFLLGGQLLLQFLGVFIAHDSPNENLEKVEDPAPAYLAGMDNRIGINRDSIEYGAGTPGLARRINRHINHYGRADDVIARNAADESAVERILPVVSHQEIAIFGDGEWKERGLTNGLLDKRQRIAWFGYSDGVVFVQHVAVDVDVAVVNVNRFAGKADDALDDIGSVSGHHRTENYDLFAFRRAPQRRVNVSERNPDIVAKPAHDEVVADQQRILHGLGWNHSRLTNRGVDEKKNKNHPEPRERFAANLLFRGQVFFRLSGFFFLRFRRFSFHVSP